MAKSGLILTLLISFTSQWSAAAIYGRDDRREVTEFPELNEVRKSVAAVVFRDFLAPNEDGTIHLDMAESLGESSNVCPSFRFKDQLSAAYCTAFLVDEQTVVSAGHCFTNVTTEENKNTSWCQGFSFYFDFTWSQDAPSDPTRIPAENIYHCQKIVRVENEEATKVPMLGDVNGNDFAVIRLDRKVVGRRPLQLSQSRPEVGESVYTLGHPFGLPMKHSGHGRVLNTQLSRYISAFLDTLSGNSGGPVFNARNEVVGILSSGHEYDTYTPQKRSCEALNICDDQGLNCIEPSDLQNVNQAFDIQLIRPWLPAVLR